MKTMRCFAPLLAVFVFTLGCARWVPADPAILSAPDPSAELVLQLLIDLRAHGYSVAEHDVPLGFLRVLAKTKSGVTVGLLSIPRTTNYFLVQFDPEGSLTVRPDGDLVRHGGAVMHRALRQELDAFAGIVNESVNKIRIPAKSPVQSL
jgi:hypothetical protein